MAAPRISSEQGWSALSHALAKTVPLQLYRARRNRRALRHLTGKPGR